MNPISDETLMLLKGSLASPDEALSRVDQHRNGAACLRPAGASQEPLPFVTPIRNVMPRVGGGTGAMTNWRQVSAIIGSGFDAMGWVPEGQRSGQMSYTTSNRSASYVTIGEEDAATFEAISAGRQF